MVYEEAKKRRLSCVALCAVMPDEAMQPELQARRSPCPGAAER